jgi:hypothetical protein
LLTGTAHAVRLSDPAQIVEDNDTVIRLRRTDGLLENRPAQQLGTQEAEILKKYRADHPLSPSMTRRKLRQKPRPLLVNKDGIRIFPSVTDVHAAILTGTVVGYEEASALSTVVLSAGSRFWEPQFKDDSGETDSFWPKIIAKLEAQNPGNAVRQDPFVTCMEYLKNHGKEVFWTIRVNDTHDHNLPVKSLHGWKQRMASTTDKKGNPFLVGTTSRPPRFARPNALNYDNFEVRKKFIRAIKAGVDKLAGQHRLDGIELDFTRHTILFKSVADGGKASDRQLALITDLVRLIRKDLDQTALDRGRPILLMVRIPDSVEFCRAIGIDIEEWLKEDLVDMVVNSDYYMLSSWSSFADFCHRYDVPYYACLERRRIEQNVPDASSSASMSVPIRPELWRGEALNAWSSGVDGIYIFNRPMARAEVFSLNLHDPSALKRMHFPEIIRQTERRSHSPWADPNRWAREWNSKP